MQKLTRKIFVSYSRTDLNKVKPLVRLLKASDVDVFIDVEDIQYGERWEAVIEEKVKQAERFLIFWSKSAAKSEYVRREYLAALEVPQMIVIPVSLDGTPLPSELAQFQALTELQPLLAKAKGTVTNYRLAVMSLFAILLLGGLANVWFLTARSANVDRSEVVSVAESKPASDSRTTSSAPSAESAPPPLSSPSAMRSPTPKLSPIPLSTPLNSNEETVARSIESSEPSSRPTAPQTESANESYLVYLIIALFCVALFALLITIYILRARKRRLASSINEILFDNPLVTKTAAQSKP